MVFSHFCHVHKHKNSRIFCFLSLVLIGQSFFSPFFSKGWNYLGDILIFSFPLLFKRLHLLEYIPFWKKATSCCVSMFVVKQHCLVSFFGPTQTGWAAAWLDDPWGGGKAEKGQHKATTTAAAGAQQKEGQGLPAHQHLESSHAGPLHQRRGGPSAQVRRTMFCSLQHWPDWSLSLFLELLLRWDMLAPLVQGQVVPYASFGPLSVYVWHIFYKY